MFAAQVQLGNKTLQTLETFATREDAATYANELIDKNGWIVIVIELSTVEYPTVSQNSYSNLRDAQAQLENTIQAQAEKITLLSNLLEQSKAANEATDAELDEVRRDIMDIAYFESQADIVRKEKKEQVKRIIGKLRKRIQLQAHKAIQDRCRQSKEVVELELTIGELEDQLEFAKQGRKAWHKASQEAEAHIANLQFQLREQTKEQSEAVTENIELRKAYFTLLCESEAQADTIRELRQELSETKCKALSDSLPFDPRKVW